MGTPRTRGRVWTPEEDELIKAHLYEFPFPAPALSLVTGRTVHSLKARAQRWRMRLQLDTFYNPGQTRRVKGVVFHMDKSKASKRAGERKCLGCQQQFKSWDVRKNQLCPKCGSQRDDGVVYHSAVGLRKTL